MLPPGGEVLSCPATVDGLLVPDGGAWDATGRTVKNADRLRVCLVDPGAGTLMNIGTCEQALGDDQTANTAAWGHASMDFIKSFAPIYRRVNRRCASFV